MLTDSSSRRDLNALEQEVTVTHWHSCFMSAIMSLLSSPRTITTPQYLAHDSHESYHYMVYLQGLNKWMQVTESPDLINSNCCSFGLFPLTEIHCFKQDVSFICIGWYSQSSASTKTGNLLTYVVCMSDRCQSFKTQNFNLIWRKNI